MKCFLSTLLFLGCCSFLVAQTEFVDGGSSYFTKPVHSGVAVAIADVDGDFLDDIVSFDEGSNLVISLYRGAEAPLVIGYEAPFPIGDVWSVVVGDVTGDGRADIMTGSVFDVQLFTQGDDFTFTRRELFEIDWLPQTANLADIDQDGYLDFFLCNDDGLNLVLINDGFGNFEASDVIDFATVPSSDNSGSYGSIWTDIDNDGDTDLYIAKCRAGATELTDPRRINVLYINNGDGSYTEMAADFGLADGLQSWSADAGDVDNDGDTDLFITNHDGPHKLYINEGATFVEYPYLQEPIISFAFQGVFHDVDNNGWLDIVISDGKYNNILYNDNMQFTKASYQVSGIIATTSIVGDLNRDGFADIWAQFPDGGFTGGSNNFQADRIWWNQGNDNNYIVFSLSDQINRTIAGTKVRITSASGTKVREIKLGSSYGQQSSSGLHFGLGADTEVESATIFYPDGEITTLDSDQLQVNTHYVLYRRGCLTQVENIAEGNLAFLCPGGELTLTSVQDIPVNWNTNPNIPMPSINVSSVGSYAYQYQDLEGCRHYSDYLVVKEEASFYEMVLDTDPEVFICDGAAINLESLPAAAYLWNTGADTQSIEVSTSGLYAVTVTSDCGIDYLSDSVQVNTIMVDTPIVLGDTVAIGQSATLISDVEMTNWYSSEFAIEPLLTGSTFTTEPLSGPATYYAEAITADYYVRSRTGVLDLPTESKYSANFQSSGLLFTVKNPIVINSVLVETDTPGERTIIITSLDLLDTFHVTEILLEDGPSRVELSAALTAGRYLISTDVNKNIENFGFASPRLSRLQGDQVQYPYELGNEMTITGGTNGITRYHYFFDWDVSHDYHTCESERVAVEAGTYPVQTNSIDRETTYFWPNPASDRIIVNKGDGSLSIALYQVDGSIALPRTVVASSGVIDVSHVQSGLYILEGTSSGAVLFREKIVIVK